MAFAGGIKFFDKSMSLKKDGSSIVVSTGSGDYALDRNPHTVWRSVGSDDTTTETLTVTFPEAITFSRILLLGHNFKEFNIQYDLASVWTHFAAVIGLDGALANISETVFADNTAYYEFTAVSTTGLRIQVLKSQVVDAQKYLSQIIVTNELGSLEGYPEISSVIPNKNLVVGQAISGRVNVSKSIETFQVTLDFNDYPAQNDDDLDLMFALYDRKDPFLVWICGGNRGSTYYRYTLRGFRLIDAIPMQVIEAPDQAYRDNISIAPVNLSFQLAESIV